MKSVSNSVGSRGIGIFDIDLSSVSSAASSHRVKREAYLASGFWCYVQSVEIDYFSASSVPSPAPARPPPRRVWLNSNILVISFDTQQNIEYTIYQTN